MSLFNSRVPLAVRENLIINKWRADAARQEEAESRYNLYSDDYEDIIIEALKKLFCKTTFDRLYYHVNGSQNMVKRVINQISTVYKVAAQRTLDKPSDRYDQLQGEVGLDSRMKKVNRLTNLLNEMIGVVAIRDGKMVLDIVSPANCMVIQDEDNPTKMNGLCYMRTLVNTPDSTLVEYPYWDIDGNYRILDEDMKPKSILYTPADYPYRDKQGQFVLPAVAFHRQHPEDNFWDQDSGRDLYSAGVAMGVKMTLFDYLFKVGTVKQIYIVGENINIPDKQIHDQLSLLTATSSAQGNAQIGVLDMQMNFEQLVTALTFQLNSVINNYGISADMWSLSISEMSGRALKIRNSALLESRQEQQETYRTGEAALFDVMRIVNNTHAGYFGWKKIPEDAQFAVDFGEIDFPEDPLMEMAIEKERLHLGINSPGKFYMRFNPDVTDEKEAERLWMENINKTQAMRDANPSFDEMLNSIMQPKGKGQPGNGVGNSADETLAAALRGNA